MTFQGCDSQVILYDYAMRFVGTPYRWGGDDPMAGFDCSGLVCDLLQSVGVVARGYRDTAGGIHTFFSKLAVPGADFGTLAFFGAPAISHIGFCLNPDLMLEAGGGTHLTTTLAVAEEQNAYVRVRPIKTRKDFVGFCLPQYPWNKGAK